MNTAIQQRESIQRRSKSMIADLTADRSPLDDDRPIDMVIASLVDQLKRENENIARLMQRQRELRVELLKAQEQSLAALRRSPGEVSQ